MVNTGFTVLAIFHLAYLGLMFGAQSPEEMDLELQVIFYNIIFFLFSLTFIAGIFYGAYSKQMGSS